MDRRTGDHPPAGEGLLHVRDRRARPQGPQARVQGSRPRAPGAPAGGTAGAARRRLQGGGGLRRGRRGGQGRHRQPPQRVDGPPVAHHSGLRGAVPGGTGAAGVLEVLARSPPQGPHRLFPELVVFPAVARPGPRAHRRRRARPAPGPGGRLREGAGGRRGALGEVLDAPEPQRPEAPAQDPGERPPPALAGDPHGLGALAPLRPVRGRSRTRDPQDQRGPRPVAHRGGGGCVLPEPHRGWRAPGCDRPAFVGSGGTGLRGRGAVGGGAGARRLPHGAQHPGPLPVRPQEGVRRRGQAAPGPALPPAPASPGTGDLDPGGVRGVGRRGQGRRDPAVRGGARRPARGGDPLPLPRPPRRSASTTTCGASGATWGGQAG